VGLLARNRPNRSHRGESWGVVHTAGRVAKRHGPDISLTALVFEDFPDSIVVSFWNEDVGNICPRVNDTRQMSDILCVKHLLLLRSLLDVHENSSWVILFCLKLQDTLQGEHLADRFDLHVTSNRDMDSRARRGYHGTGYRRQSTPQVPSVLSRLLRALMPS
jgi:hypothetical protein